MAELRGVVAYAGGLVKPAGGVVAVAWPFMPDCCGVCDFSGGCVHRLADVYIHPLCCNGVVLPSAELCVHPE